MNEEEKVQKIEGEAQNNAVEMKALKARVTALEEQNKAKDEAIALRDKELAELKRKDAVTNLYNKVRNVAEGLVKSNAPKLSTAEFEALGFTGDIDADIKNLLADDNAAIDDLIAQKPHLRSRKPVGDVGQGKHGFTNPMTILDVLKSRA